MDKAEQYANELIVLQKKLDAVEQTFSATKKKLTELYAFQGYHSQVVSQIEGALEGKRSLVASFADLPFPVRCAEAIKAELDDFYYGADLSRVIANKQEEQNIIKQKIHELETNQISLQRQKNQLNTNITTCITNLNKERANNA